MRADTVAEQLFFTTTRIETRKGTSGSVGTGFIVAVETTQGAVHFVVTNRHVFEGADEATVRMVRSDGDAPLMGAATEITVRRFSAESWAGHPDDDIDVAVLPFAPIVDAMAEIGGMPFFRAVTPDFFAGPDLLAGLDAIEEVTFVGYPNGLFDSANYLPIARRGTTATPLEVDYQGKPTFLIDGAVFPGSSGSPVFLLDRGMYHARDGGTVVGSRFAFLGVVAAVHVRVVSGRVVQAPTGLEARMEDPLGLGIVYRAETVLQTIDRVLASLGMTRTEETPSADPGTLTGADDVVAEELGPPGDAGT